MTAALLGALAGLGYGFIAQKGAFCLNSGFRNAFTTHDTTKVKAFALAVAVQMVLLPPIFLTGVVAPTVPALFPVGAVVGGLLFGASMRWAAGCAAGVLFKIGGGSLGAIPATLGMIAGASAMELSPLRAVRDALRGPEVTSHAAFGLALGGAGGGLLVAFGLVGAVLLWRTRVSSAGDWTWRRTGTLLGLLATAAWVLSGLAGRDFGLAVIPGAVGVVSGLLELGAPPWFDVALLVGIVAGGRLAVARRAPPLTRVSTADAVRRVLGGVGLGVGATLAAGCTVGHGLAGLPLLAPGSALTVVAIFVGANLTPLHGRLRARFGARSPLDAPVRGGTE